MFEFCLISVSSITVLHVAACGWCMKMPETDVQNHHDDSCINSCTVKHCQAVCSHVSQFVLLLNQQMCKLKCDFVTEKDLNRTMQCHNLACHLHKGWQIYLLAPIGNSARIQDIDLTPWDRLQLTWLESLPHYASQPCPSRVDEVPVISFCL